MTLIANTINYSFPIIVGDILMSTNFERKNISIPTFLKGIDALLPPEQKLFPYSLRQKIYVITDNLVIGFAGIEYQIKLFLEDIRIFFRAQKCDTASIYKFFDEYDYSNFDGSSYLAIYSEETNKGILINKKHRGQWTISESPTFQGIIANGSGAQDFIEHARTKYHAANFGDNNPLQKAIALNYINLCNLLSIESLSLTTLKKYWGAGFEMIYFDGKKFIKMDDIMYVIWKGFVDLDSEKYKVEPFLAMNYQYFDDTLLITATDFKLVERYGVPPIDRNIKDIDISVFPNKPNFQSSKICSSYVLELSNGKISTPAFFWESKLSHNIISIKLNSERKFEVMVRKDAEEYCIAAIRAVIKENKIK